MKKGSIDHQHKRSLKSYTHPHQPLRGCRSIDIKLILGASLVLFTAIWFAGCTKQDTLHIRTIIVEGNFLFDPQSNWRNDFSPDGAFVASGFWGLNENDEVIKIWRLSDGSLQRTIKLRGFNNMVKFMTFDSSGNILATAHGDQNIRIWRVRDGELLKTLKSPFFGSTDLSFSPDGKILASCHPAGILILWNLEDCSVIRSQGSPKSPFIKAKFIHDGKEILAGTTNGEIQILRANDGAMIRSFGLTNVEMYTLRVAKNESTVATVYSNGSIGIWNVSDGSRISTIKTDSSKGYSIAIDPSGQLLATGCIYADWMDPSKILNFLFNTRDYRINLYRTSDGALLRTMKGHKWNVISLNFSPDGTMLASSGYDRSIQLWDMKPFHATAF